MKKTSMIECLCGLLAAGFMMGVSVATDASPSQDEKIEAASLDEMLRMIEDDDVNIENMWFRGQHSSYYRDPLNLRIAHIVEKAYQERGKVDPNKFIEQNLREPEERRKRSRQKMEYEPYRELLGEIARFEEKAWALRIASMRALFEKYIESSHTMEKIDERIATLNKGTGMWGERYDEKPEDIPWINELKAEILERRKTIENLGKKYSPQWQEEWGDLLRVAFALDSLGVPKFMEWSPGPSYYVYPSPPDVQTEEYRELMTALQEAQGRRRAMEMEFLYRDTETVGTFKLADDYKSILTDEEIEAIRLFRSKLDESDLQ